MEVAGSKKIKKEENWFGMGYSQFDQNQQSHGQNKKSNQTNILGQAEYAPPHTYEPLLRERDSNIPIG